MPDPRAIKPNDSANAGGACPAPTALRLARDAIQDSQLALVLWGVSEGRSILAQNLFGEFVPVGASQLFVVYDHCPEIRFIERIASRPYCFAYPTTARDSATVGVGHARPACDQTKRFGKRGRGVPRPYSTASSARCYPRFSVGARLVGCFRGTIDTCPESVRRIRPCRRVAIVRCI